jgi:hypothetical protein
LKLLGFWDKFSVFSKPGSGFAFSLIYLAAQEWVMVDERIPSIVPFISICDLHQHGKMFPKRAS